jgi:hypothetical protein
MALFALVGTWFLAEEVTENRARRELLHAVSQASTVVINGRPLVDPTVTLSALRGTAHIPAHHSSPTAPIHLELRAGNTSTAITIARDSERPDEFWVYLPGSNWHNDPLGRDAGRIVSKPLGSFLHDRGL